MSRGVAGSDSTKKKKGGGKGIPGKSIELLVLPRAQTGKRRGENSWAVVVVNSAALPCCDVC